MKLITTAGQLNAALAAVAPVVETRVTYPALSCVLIEGGRVKGTNLDVEITCAIACEQAEGAAVIELRTLKSLIAGIPQAARVSLMRDGEGVAIKFGNAEYRLPTISVDAFPNPIEKPEGAGYSFGDELGDGLRFVARCMSTEETRYYLNGACFSKGVNGAPDYVVGTDGRRLGACPLAFPETWDGAIVPHQAVRLLAATKGEISGLINPAKTVAQFVNNGVTLRCKLIEGTFPDWRRVLPGDNARGVPFDLDRAEALAAVRRLLSLSGHGPFASRAMMLTGTKRAVAIGANNSGGERVGKERLMKARVVEGKGERGAVTLNARFFGDLLAMFSRQGRICLELGVDHRLLRVDGERGEIAALMPMRGETDTLDAWIESLPPLQEVA